MSPSPGISQSGDLVPRPPTRSLASPPLKSTQARRAPFARLVRDAHSLDLRASPPKPRHTLTRSTRPIDLTDKSRSICVTSAPAARAHRHAARCK